MSGYTKLFASIVGSTIWQEDLATKVMWITMLAMSDSEGIVEGSVPGLAHIAGVTVQEAERALEKFQQPDKYSRTPDYDGRRIEVVDGGWLILNRAKYRDKDWQEDKAERRRKVNHRYYESQKLRPNSDRKSLNQSESDSVRDKKKEEKEKLNSKAIVESKTDSTPPLTSLLAPEKDSYGQAIQDVWDYYIEKTGRNSASYLLTPEREAKGISRLRDVMRLKKLNLMAAVDSLKLAVDGLVADPWCNGSDPRASRKYIDWTDNLFKSYAEMEKRINFALGELKAVHQ